MPLNFQVKKIVRGPKIRVQLSDGEELEADFVIVTVSLGVLQAQAHSLFEPGLPSRKLEAIEKLEIGSVDKIYLEFEDPWYEKQGRGQFHKSSKLCLFHSPTFATQKSSLH